MNASRSDPLPVEGISSSATGALWLFLSLLIGAFVASLAATFGGRRRDA